MPALTAWRAASVVSLRAYMASGRCACRRAAATSTPVAIVDKVSTTGRYSSAATGSPVSVSPANASAAITPSATPGAISDRYGSASSAATVCAATISATACGSCSSHAARMSSERICRHSRTIIRAVC